MNLSLLQGKTLASRSRKDELHLFLGKSLQWTVKKLCSFDNRLCHSIFLSHFQEPMTPTDKFLTTTNVWAQCRNNQAVLKIIYVELFFRISTGKRQCGTSMFPSLSFHIYLEPNSNETINSLSKHSLPTFYFPVIFPILMLSMTLLR